MFSGRRSPSCVFGLGNGGRVLMINGPGFFFLLSTTFVALQFDDSPSSVSSLQKCSFRKIKKNLLNSFFWVVFLTNVWQTMHVNTIWYLWISCEEMDFSQFGMLFIGKMGGKYNFVKMPGYLKLTILWCCKFISFFSHFFHVFDVRIKFFRGISQIFKFPVTIIRI